ncbi:integrase [Iodobacter sp. BJB302]|nr:integrase [Iodobacter sp. BJB302]
MADLKHFSPKSELSASENLAEFIRMCRYDLTVFGSRLSWDDTSWPKAANFTKLGVKSKGYGESDRMNEVFIDFAKSYFRYQQGHHPTGTKNESKALRVIEAALLQVHGTAAITRLDTVVLDEAAALARGHYSPIAAYHCGRELQKLACFVSEKSMIPSDLSTWKSPIKKPSDISIQTGTKAKEIQEKKLPNQAALGALAEIFANNPTDPKDIFTSSTFAMTMCAPVRISEILDLPVDCEVEERDTDGAIQYGWRFFSGKSYEGDIKWIPEVMVPIAKEAVRRIRVLTSKPRQLAEWIGNNPSTPYRHEQCPDVADDEPLTMFQVCAFLGFKSETRKDCRTALCNIKITAKDGVHTLNRLWQQTINDQPDGFPWLNIEKKIRYSNALFCMSRNLIGSQRGTSPVILWAPTNSIFNNDLSPRESLPGHHQSIFDRYGFKTGNGDRLKLTSHQARHLLTTLANRGGLTQEQLAKWAGRADKKQNRVYNHMSEWEMVAKAEALDTSLTLFGPKGEVSQHVPVSKQEINLMERGAMHVSLWGVCAHDFIMSPCEKFRDCLNCEEHVCIKGQGKDNCERLTRIKMRLAQVEKDFTEAQAAISNGYAGADRWYEYHLKTLERLRQLVEILESAQVPDGAQIKLCDGKDYSHLRRVIRLKVVESGIVEQKVPDTALLSNLSRLLGDSYG